MFKLEYIANSVNFCILHQDTHRLDLKDFSHGGANITALRLLDDTDQYIARIMQEMTDIMTRVVGSGSQEYPHRMGVSHSCAIMYLRSFC